MPLSTGQRLGPYEIISSIGAGGMGEVYRALDLRLDRHVALKVLPEILSIDPIALARFQREAKALAALSHPNILAIYDIGHQNEQYFVVMELLEGETLRARLATTQLPWRRAIEIGLSIAEGLSAAHSKKVIHRDLKPENIFITSSGLVKILDFGLAQMERTSSTDVKTTAPTISKTAPGIVMGTVPYMSPEQARGQDLDARSDIFSFGSVLYEMITRRRAFGGTSTADTFAAILKEDPPELTSLASEIPAQIQSLISHCLEKKPEERFQTARDLAFALKETLSDSDVSRTVRRKSSQPQVSNRSRFLYAIPVVIIILLGIYFIPHILPRDEGIHSIAILPFVNTTKNPDSDYLSDGITQSIIDNLARIPKLRVMAHATVFTFKDRNIDPRKIGRDLDVEAVVTGRVAERDGILLINADLIKVSDGSQLWGEEYSTNFSDIFPIQSEISQKIAQGLRITLTGEQKQLLAKQLTDNSEAYRFILKGNYYWNKSTEEDYEKARTYYQQAIELDPTYALAYVSIGDYYESLGFDGYRSPGEAFPKAESAYKKALTLDSQIQSQTHTSLATLALYYKWNWAEAQKEYQQGIEFNSGDPTSYGFYADYFLAMGKIDDAIKEIQMALKLDPLSRMWNVLLGQYLLTAGRYDEAIKQIQETIRMEPQYDVAHISLSDALELKKDYTDAADESAKAYRLMGDDVSAEMFEKANDESSYLNAKRIVINEKLASLQEISQNNYVSAIDFARLYAELGQKEEAFQWLEKAYQERSPQIVFLNSVKDWNLLRSDPRFTTIVKRIGLPQK